MQLKIIKTKKNYPDALSRFEEIFQAKTGTKDSEEADVLALLIKEYEDQYELVASLSKNGALRSSLVEAARIELGLKAFLEKRSPTWRLS